MFVRICKAFAILIGNMYHKKSKRREFITRVLVYGVMTLTVITIVTVAFLYTIGYRFDQSDRTVELSGLVQFTSVPTSATVEIDSVAQSQTTPAKRAVNPGSHEFVMWREGYETWRKTMTIEAGTLTWLNYARLIPKERTAESVASLAGVSSTLASPNKKTLAGIDSSGTNPSVRFYDINRETPIVKDVTIQPRDYFESDDKKGHTFKLHQWSYDSQRVLIEHTYKKNREWIVIDQQDGEVVENVSQRFDLAISQVYFPEGNSSVLYAQTGSTVRRINIADDTVSAPLVANVDSFSLNKDTLSYRTTVDEATAKQSVGVMRYGQQPVLVHEQSTKGTPLQITTAHYYNSDYIAVADDNEVIIYRGDLPTTVQAISGLTKVYQIENENDAFSDVEFSPTGRVILAYHKSGVTSYDLEREELFRGVSGDVTVPKNGQRFEWLDNYYLWSDWSVKDAMTLREFDGANVSTIATVVLGYDASLTSNGTYLYFTGKKADGTLELQRIRMILR